MKSQRLSRRQFLRLGALTAGSALLAGCGQPAAPAAPARRGPHYCARRRGAGGGSGDHRLLVAPRR